MIALVIVLAVALAGLAAAFAARESHERRRRRLPTASAARILFPFTGAALSQRGLDAALRIARVEEATLVPAYLARVPLHLPLDAALPRQCDSALPLLEAVEQQAVRTGVAVDARIERGRTYRHAIGQLVAHEQADTMVVTAGGSEMPGLLPDDVSWVLEHVAGEIIVIRPGVADLQALLTDQRQPRQRLRPSRSANTRERRRAQSRPPLRCSASDVHVGRG
ncbi:MAG TPA: universal stress protein [Steroidobacteraceae bacterium]|nr:universal stress protein [Steroidobacteraceae bacterium]